MNRFRFENI